MRKFLIIIGLMLASSSVHASVATATNLINAGNLPGALDEIGRLPRTQWSQKKQLLFNTINHWNPAQQPELAKTINNVARANLTAGHAQEVYQRVAKAVKAQGQAAVEQRQPQTPSQPVAPPPSPIINEILEDPNIPQDVRKQINQMPADQRVQLENALNSFANENQWTNSPVVRGLLAGVGVLGLRWLWNWFQNWRVGAAAPPGGISSGPLPVPPLKPQADAAALKQALDDLANERAAHAVCQQQLREFQAIPGGPQLPTATDMKRCQDELTAAQLARKNCEEKLQMQIDQYEKEHKGRLEAIAEADKFRRDIVGMRGKMGDMEKELTKLRAESITIPALKPMPVPAPSPKSSRPTELEPAPTPLFHYPSQWVTWFSLQFNRFNKAVAAGTLNDLREAISELHVIEHNTQDVPSMIQIIENNPTLRTFLVNQGFYPAKNLYERKEDLAARTLAKLNELIKKTSRSQDDFEKDINTVIASEQPITSQMQKLYQDDYKEAQEGIAIISGFLDDIEKYLSPTSPANSKLLDELKTKLSELRAQLKKNNGLLNRLGKRTSEAGNGKTVRPPQKEIKEREEKEGAEALPPGLQRALAKKEKKNEEMILPLGPSAFAHFVAERKDRIVKGYPHLIERYKAAIAKQPQSMENLVEASKHLMYIQRTMSYPEIIAELDKQPDVKKLLTQEGFYPLNVLQTKTKQLVTRIVEMANSQADAIRKEQDVLRRALDKIVASTEPITQNEIFEYTAMDAKVRKAVTRLQNAIDKFKPWVPTELSPFSDTGLTMIPGGTELIAKLKGLQASLKKNETALDQLKKREE